MKVRRTYEQEREKSLKAIDIALDAFKKCNTGLSPDQIEMMIKGYNDFKALAENPEPQFRRVASMDSLKDIILTYFQEGSGEVVEYFWKEIEAVAAYEKKTTVEFSIATIDSSMLGPIDFEPYTLLMLRTWGVGKKEKNNGILIVLAPDSRRIRIQNGYGIEKFLTNEQTKEIIDTTFIPYFKKGKFYNGTKEGILAIISMLEKNGL
jgi:hypothetical protein